MSPATADLYGDRGQASEPGRDLAASRSGPPDSEEGASTILTPDSEDEEKDDHSGAVEEDGIELRVLKTRRGGDGREYHGVDARDEWEGDADSGPRSRARRASASTVASFQLYTPDEERAVVRKFDRRLVLFVALLYMLSFLDRSSAFPPPLLCSLSTASFVLIYSPYTD